jgi:hypothetical protein
MDFAIHPLPDLSPFCALVARSTSVHMYEGVPHQMFERELLAPKLAAHATISLSSFPFYEGMMKLQDADARFLTEIFSASTPYNRTTQVSCGVAFIQTLLWNGSIQEAISRFSSALAAASFSCFLAQRAFIATWTKNSVHS